MGCTEPFEQVARTHFSTHRPVVVLKLVEVLAVSRVGLVELEVAAVVASALAVLRAGYACDNRENSLNIQSDTVYRTLGSCEMFSR